MNETLLPSGSLQGLEVLHDLPPLTTQSLLAGSRLLRHRHRAPLIRAGDDADHFALVVSGCYKMLKPRPDGGGTLIAFATSGEPIGLLTMAETGPHGYPIDVESLGLSSALWIPKRTYEEVWLREPRVMRRMHLALLKRSRDLHADRASQHLPLPARIGLFLLRHLERSGIDDRGLLKFPLTRREIAEAVGAQTESVVRVMSAWQKSDWISTCERHIEIRHPDRIAHLIELAESPS